MIIKELKITNASGESISFGRHFRLSEDIDLSGLKADVSYSESSQDGSSYQRTRLDNKDFSVPFFILKSVEENEWIEERRQEAYRVFNPKKNKMKVDFTTKSGKSYYINAELVALPTFPTEFESNNKRWQKGLLQFTASDPYIYESNETLVQIATWVPSFEFPLDIPADLDIYKFPEQIRGGRNLVENTNFNQGFTNQNWIIDDWAYDAVTVLGSKSIETDSITQQKNLSVTSTVQSNSAYLYFTTRAQAYKESRFILNNSYAISAEVLCSQGCQVVVSTEGIHDGTVVTIPPNTWIKITDIYTITKYNGGDLKRITFGAKFFNTSGTKFPVGTIFKYRKLKVEMSNKVTPWTLASEDLGLTYPSWLQNFTESFNENGIVLSENTENTYESCIEMGYRSPSLIANAFNDGQDDIGMIIKFKANGPVTNPSLINVNTYEEFKFKDGFSMLNGDVVEVSTYDKNLYVRLTRNNITTSIFGQAHLYTDWLKLATGDNLFRYNSVDGIDNLEISMYFTSKFLGV